MSAVSESVTQRMTLGYLADRYGFELSPAFAGPVTITSLADDIDSIRPGALYIPSRSVDLERLEQAQERGAYAALVPHAMRPARADIGMPLLFAEPTDGQLGRLAAELTGNPSSQLAVFAVAGPDPKDVESAVRRAARVLHMLGNPVGIISAYGSASLERQLGLGYPLSILDVQRTLAVCAEDGAAAVVIALDGRTLADGALSGVSVDVLGAVGAVPGQGATPAERMRARFGFDGPSEGRTTVRTSESDALAEQAAPDLGREERLHLSLAVSMMMAAGVRRNNIRNALRVADELM